MKLNKITLQNFRAFHSFNDKLKFSNKSVLIYGENGSGKSSIFWALHAFVHYYNHEAKSKLYFAQGDEKSLLNLFNTTEDGFIKITFDDDVEYTYDQAGMTTGIQTKLTNLSRVKSFLTYKDLLGLDMMHSYENELFTKKILLELLTGDIILTDVAGENLGTQERLERMELLLHHPLEITYYKDLEDKKNQLYVDIENLEFLFSGEVGEVEIRDKEGDVTGLEFYAISPDSFEQLKDLDDRVKSFIEHYDFIFDDDASKKELIDNWEGSINEIEPYVEGTEVFNKRAEMYNNVYSDSGESDIGAYIDNIETTLSDFEDTLLAKDFSTKFSQFFTATDTVEKLYSDWKTIREAIDAKINLMNTGPNKINTLLEKLGYDNLDVTILIDYGKTKILDFGVKFNGKDVEHHKFLNEAKLSAINLAFYFSAILSYTKPDIPILVLDDLLISLDMGNRAKVLDLITDQDLFEGYQLFILTHERSFFEMAKYKFDFVQNDQWEYFEMYVDTRNTHEKPFITQSLSYLEKAEKYLVENEYEIAGNFLRKEAESFCKSFLPKKLQYSPDFALFDLNGLILNSKKYAEEAGLDSVLFSELDTHRKFVLNPTSHDNHDVPKYRQEIEDCLETLKKLRKIKIQPFLKRGDVIKFELVTSDGKDTYRFEIILEDDFRILQIGTSMPVVSKGMVNYSVYKNGRKTKDELQHDNNTLKKFYDKICDKSDKTKSNDFWEEIIIQSTGEKISTIIT